MQNESEKIVPIVEIKCDPRVTNLFKYKGNTYEKDLMEQLQKIFILFNLFYLLS